MSDDWTSDWTWALSIFVGCVFFIPVIVHIFPKKMAPGSGRLIFLHAVSAVVTFILSFLNIYFSVDPYPFGILYGGALMMLCTETWFFEDPQLFNGSLFKGWPFFLFHLPGEDKTLAPVPMAGYTRVFASWHAGGTCVNFFIHVLAIGFRQEEKSLVSLALAMLWIIWAATNSWRAIYGSNEFSQAGIIFHSLAGPGCGLCGYTHFAYFLDNRIGSISTGEVVCIAYFCLMVVFCLIWMSVKKWDVYGTKEESVLVESKDVETKDY